MPMTLLMKIPLPLVLVMLLLPYPSGAVVEPDFSILQQRSEKGAPVHGSLLIKGSGCSFCHSLAGGSGSLSDREEWTCLFCHSKLEDPEIKSRKKAKVRPELKGRLSAMYGESDILGVYRKKYTHPTLTVSGVHSSKETLPEEDPQAPRHAECFDCHHPHEVSRWNRFGPLKVTGAKGEEKAFLSLKEIKPGKEFPEYELCFNCHSDSYNLPVDSENKRLEFDEGNPSYHPVVAEGKNSTVPSLVAPYKESAVSPGDVSIIKCTDCHNNDDEKGPRGPHGSIYPFILARNYSLQDEVDERPQDYELCYGCHSRSSILGDVSFKYHSLHIRGDLSRGVRGTGCYTCRRPREQGIYPSHKVQRRGGLQESDDDGAEIRGQGRLPGRVLPGLSWCRP